MDELIKAFKKAKAVEQAAKKIRLAAQKDLLNSVKLTKLEGTETFKTNNFELKVSSKLKRTLDFEAYKALELPRNLLFVKLKPTIDLKKLKAIEMVDPAIIEMCVTIKPATPGIQIKEIKA